MQTISVDQQQTDQIVRKQALWKLNTKSCKQAARRNPKEEKKLDDGEKCITKHQTISTKPLEKNNKKQQKPTNKQQKTAKSNKNPQKNKKNTTLPGLRTVETGAGSDIIPVNQLSGCQQLEAGDRRSVGRSAVGDTWPGESKTSEEVR